MKLVNLSFIDRIKIDELGLRRVLVRRGER